MKHMLRLGVAPLCGWFMGASLALAGGGMTGGGGELPNDLLNPWWVDNTTQVSYCIALDAEHFGTSLEAARSQIKEALAYWKAEFAHTDLESGELPLHLASQTFVEERCAPTTDLRFQMAAPTAEQAAYLKHTDLLIGEAVRLSYDPVQLHGKGFVYISPETGPGAIEGVGDTGGSVIPQRWSVADGKLLRMVLIHELGHVFGWQHQYGMNLMAAFMPALLISYPMAYGITDETAVIHTIPGKEALLGTIYNSDDGSDPVAAQWNPYFGGDARDGYVEFRPSGASELQIYAGPTRRGPLRLLGTGTLQGHTGVMSQPLISVFLTPQQKALAFNVTGSGHTLNVFIPTRVWSSVLYKIAATGEVKHLELDREPGLVLISATDDQGQINPVVFAPSEWLFDRSHLPPSDPAGLGSSKAALQLLHLH